MKKVITLLFIVSIGIPILISAQINGNLVITGRVVDDNHNALPGVSIFLKQSRYGTVTDSLGEFSLSVGHSLPFTLVIRSIGFQDREIQIRKPGAQSPIQLLSQVYLANDVVVTASKVPEKILRSPVSIEKLDLKALKETPAASFYDALGNVKGIQFTTSSITFKVPNTRGFNIPNNFRFMQLVDGIDMQAATLGVPLGNAIGPTELDIQSIEVTPGTSSALYGLNAINGMANLLTKDPFNSEGLSIFQRTGVNQVDGKDAPAGVLTETALRYAHVFRNKIAFKVNVSYLQGTDWVSNSQQDQNPNTRNTANPAYPVLDGINNIAYDAWNKYGDDALAGSNTVSITGLTIDGQPNRTLTVARTGYWEKDLVDPKVSNLKLDAALHYRISPSTEISYSYRIGKMDGVFQRGNKVKLDDVTVQNHQMRFKSNHLTFQVYVSRENTGNSYNVKPLADNLDLYTGGSASVWSGKYKNALLAYAGSNGGALTSANLVAATQYARAQADFGRAEPGTARFAALKDTITHINNWDIRSSSIPNAPVTGGAALIQKSNLYHAEAQWDFTSQIHFAKILAGADVRVYEVIPDGNNFVDFSRPVADRSTALTNGSFGKNIYYTKFGSFVQLTKTFWNDAVKLTGSLRFDDNPDFKATLTPRIAAVYTLNDQQSFRLTFQQGYRYPALFEALSFVNNGRVRRVGILPVIDEGLGFRENSYTQASVAVFNAAVKAAGNSDAAALANRSLLEPANLPEGKPESVQALEAGYKTAWLDNRFSLDADAYLNVYKGFLGQIQVFVPIGETIGSDAAVIAMLDRNRDATAASGGNAASKGQDRYRVYTNATNTYTSYGATLGLSYRIFKTFVASGNLSYNDIGQAGAKDLFITGFNTPKWVSNISFGNRNLVKNVGFNIIWKWQTAFLWQSPLVSEAMVPAFHSIDAQFTLHLPRQHCQLKIGGTNLLNNRHIEYAGGPTIGALYYTAVTLDGLL